MLFSSHFYFYFYCIRWTSFDDPIHYTSSTHLDSTLFFHGVMSPGYWNNQDVCRWRLSFMGFLSRLFHFLNRMLHFFPQTKPSALVFLFTNSWLDWFSKVLNHFISRYRNFRFSQHMMIFRWFEVFSKDPDVRNCMGLSSTS